MSLRPHTPADHYGRPLLAWLPAVGWAALIFALSATPDLRFLPDLDLDLVVRKLGHMGIFGVLALLVWYALARTTDLPRPWAWAAGLTVLYAITDEFHQSIVAGRHASWVDVAIDAIGVVVALVIATVIRRGRAGRARPA